MDAKQFIESGTLETYVMGLATEQEAQLVAEMSARYPEVKAELKAIEASMENFDKQNAVEPPAHLKAIIMSQISSTVQSSTVHSSGKVRSINETVNSERNNGELYQPRQSNFFKYAAAVALLLLIGSLYYNYELGNRVENLSEQTSRNAYLTDSLRQALNDQTGLSANLSDQLALLKKPSMKSIELKGMADVAPDAKAMVYANTATGDSYLEIMNLPAAPDGMQYQFWGIVDGKPVDAGMIPLEGDTAGIHPMKTIPNAVAYAISLEPKGGSQQPQGKIYVMGNS